MRAAWSMALGAVVVLSGCIGNGTDEPPAPADPVWILDDPADLPPPTLLEPPTYVRGQWWEYEIVIVLGGGTTTARIVAADANATHHFIGMPADAFNDAATLSHFPAQGEITREHLGIDMHGRYFPLLDFPLEDGKTWTAPIINDATALVTVLDEHRAEVVFTGGLLPMRIVYDATLGVVTEYEVPGLVTAMLTASGFGHRGPVTVMSDFWLSMWGSAAGAVTLGPDPLTQTGLGVEAGRPIETGEVPERDAASFFIYVGNFDVLPVNGPGLYIERTTLPDGTQHVVQRLPSEGLGGTGFIGRTTAPAGTWSFEHVAAGAGVVLTEIAAYNEARHEL